MAMEILNQDLIGQFTKISPLPGNMEKWIKINWVILIKGNLSHLFCLRGFYAIFSELKPDRDLIFKKETCFYEHIGMYLNL